MKDKIARDEIERIKTRLEEIAWSTFNTSHLLITYCDKCQHYALHWSSIVDDSRECLNCGTRLRKEKGYNTLSSF